MYVKAVNTIAAVNAAAQTALFHLKTFKPSNTPKGIRLKTAKNALMNAINQKRSCPAVAIMMHTVEIIKFVTGPEMAVFPTVSFVPVPAIMTAPGEMSLKGRNIEIRVMSAPCRVSRNSAHRLKCCAENLWASS